MYFLNIVVNKSCTYMKSSLYLKYNVLTKKRTNIVASFEVLQVVVAYLLHKVCLKRYSFNAFFVLF